MDKIVEVLREHWEATDYDGYPDGCICGWNRIEEDMEVHVAEEILKVVTLG